MLRIVTTEKEWGGGGGGGGGKEGGAGGDAKSTAGESGRESGKDDSGNDQSGRDQGGKDESVSVLFVDAMAPVAMQRSKSATSIGEGVLQYGAVCCGVLQCAAVCNGCGNDRSGKNEVCL